IGRIGRTSDRVEIALPELSEPAVGGILTAPYRSQVVPLERRAKLVDVLSREARKRNRKIVTKGHIPAAMIIAAIDELVRFFTAFPKKDFGVLQGRCVDWSETVRTDDAPCLFEQVLTWDH